MNKSEYTPGTTETQSNTPASSLVRRTVGGLLAAACLVAPAACSSSAPKEASKVIHLNTSMTPAQRLRAELVTPYQAKDTKDDTIQCFYERPSQVVLYPHKGNKNGFDDESGVQVAFNMAANGVLTIIPKQLTDSAFTPQPLKFSGFNDWEHPLQAADAQTRSELQLFNCETLPVQLN